MLNVKSKVEEIAHHILQMELLLLSEKEKSQLQQILALENLLKDSSIKDLIEEDLKDEKWINDTNVLINTCYKKIEKSIFVEKHIEECRNFMIFRFMETKCATSKLEIFKQIGGWIFNEVNHRQQKTRWVSQKFIQNFNLSDVPRKLSPFMEDSPMLEVNLKWLHANRDIFFSEEIFMDLNQALKNKTEIKLDLP